MNISSFNITDVGFHYIGLRVLAAMPGAPREEQNAAISRSVLKYARDKSLRLMLPEPKSSYATVGERICQELSHFEFAEATKGRGFHLTTMGAETLGLLVERNYRELRRRMALIHLGTYANLQAVVHSHIAYKEFLSPIVEASRLMDSEYVAVLLRPIHPEISESEAKALLARLRDRTPKQIEDALRELLLRRVVPEHTLSVPLFRAMCDRLVSLRLLNAMKYSSEGGEFYRTYSPCLEEPPVRKWHNRSATQLSTGGSYAIYLSEPDFDDEETEHVLIRALDAAFSALKERAGYFDLPDVRDHVCNSMLIPEASFDEGVVSLLEKPRPSVTLGLTYERISGRRKPLVRAGETTQIYNLIRRA